MVSKKLFHGGNYFLVVIFSYEKTDMRSKVALTREEAFRILDLDQKTSLAEIKRRFQELSLKHHPDRNPEDPKAGRRYQWITLAKNILLGNQKPGYSEWNKYQQEISGRGKSPHKPPSFDPKRWVVFMARSVGGKPVKRTGVSNVFAIRLSPNVGVYLEFGKNLMGLTIYLTSLGEKSWEPLSPIRTFPKGYNDEWEYQVISLVDRYDQNTKKYEEKASGETSSPKSQNRYAKEIDLIEKILRNEYLLLGYSRELEKLKTKLISGSGRSVKEDFLLVNLHLLFELYHLMSLPRVQKSKTKEKYVSTWIARLFRGKALTSIQKSNFEDLKNQLKSNRSRKTPKKRPSPGPIRVNQTQLKKLLDKKFKPLMKDFQRIGKICSKSNPIREARTQASKITDLKKVLRRATAALLITSVKIGLKHHVAQVYLNRAFELGYSL